MTIQRVEDNRTFAPLASGWGWVTACGLLLLAAGIAAFAAPSLTTIAISLFAGWLLLGAGIAGVAVGARTRRHGRWGDLLSGVASIVAGLLILLDPWAGALSLTIALAIWFAVRGVVEAGGAARAGAGRARTTLAIIGAIDLLIAIGLFTNFPFPAVRAIGLVVGIGFLMAGAATIAAGLQMRRLTH